MTVELRRKTGQIQYHWVKKTAREILRKLQLERAELSLELVDNREIRKLNSRYRGVKRVTDVLAFPQQEGRFKKFSPELLGDVVISLPQAKLQAKLLGHSVKREITVLVIHGVLHLLGFEDESEEKKRKMFLKQKQLLKWLEKKGLVK